MSRRSLVVAVVVVALSTLGPAFASSALEESREANAPGTPLAREAPSDERPPPQASAPLAAAPGPQAASPLVDIPLRSRYPSRVFLPGLPEVGMYPPGSGLEHQDETHLIQHLYQTYSLYSERQDGERVELELTGFRTIYRPQFARTVYYPDLMTLGTDWEIRTVVRRLRHDGGEATAWYDAEWVPVENRAKNPRTSRLLGMSALDILTLGADKYPIRRRTVAITSYRVHVAYMGRTHDYKAVGRWQIDEEGNLQLAVVDNVVPEVGLAVGEKVLPRHGLLAPEKDLPFESVAAPLVSPSCIAQTFPTFHSPQQTRHNALDHLSGRHEAVYIGAFDCSCSSTCTSACEASAFVEACQDHGALIAALGEHRARAASDGIGGSQAEGQNVGATCTGGMGCVVVDCPDGACTVTVTASVGVISFSFSTDAPILLSANLSQNHTCGRCTVTDPGEDPPTGPVLHGCENWCGSPIVVDLDRGGFRFTDVAGGVRFDLDGDGERERMAWIAAGAGDGWLALDRDGDGAIGSGAELFGDFTPQPPADEPHGYLALAAYDGDGDRAITAADAVFGDLRIWLDADRDGVSQPGELSPLGAWGIVAVELDAVESRRRDPHGNELRYAARVRLDRGTTQSADVFLLRE